MLEDIKRLTCYKTHKLSTYEQDGVSFLLLNSNAGLFCSFWILHTQLTRQCLMYRSFALYAVHFRLSCVAFSQPFLHSWCLWDIYSSRPYKQRDTDLINQGSGGFSCIKDYYCVRVISKGVFLPKSDDFNPQAVGSLSVEQKRSLFPKG